MSDPFLFVPTSSLSLTEIWGDTGTSGTDWYTFYINNPPAGYACVGDHASIGNRSNASSGYSVFVPKNRPDVAKPCTSYRIVRQVTWGKIPLMVTIPECDDPDYIGVACTARRDKPRVGEYYCVNKKYIGVMPNSFGWFIQEDGVTLFYSIQGASHFLTNDVGYRLLGKKEILACCTTGTCTEFPLTSCAIMTDLCSADDIRRGGKSDQSFKCRNWCEKNPKMCDGIKLAFCSQHPNDEMCDCINATSRIIFKEEQAKLKPVSKMAPKACRTSLCSEKIDGYDSFMISEDTQALKDCPNIEYIDQSVDVNGSGNTLGVSQNAGKTNATSNTNESASNNNVVIIIIILIAIFYIYSSGKSKNSGDTSGSTNSILKSFFGGSCGECAGGKSVST